MKKKKMVRKRRLTLRERRFIQGLAEGKTGAQAARDAGYSERSIYALAHENLRKPKIQLAIKDIMESQGITDGRLMNVLDDGLKAEKVIGYLHQFKRTTGEGKKTERIQPDEIISNDFVEAPDHSVRHKYLVTALELKGHAKRVNGDQVVQIFVTRDGIEKKQGIIARAQSVSSHKTTSVKLGNF